MFSDFEAKTISFYKKKKNITEEAKLIQTEDFTIEFEEKLIQSTIRKEKLTQTEISEIAALNKQTNIDQDKIKKFFDKVFPLITEALSNTTEENLSNNHDNLDYDSDEEEEKTLSNDLLVRIPTVYTDKNLKISDSCWNSRGNILYATSHYDQHLGPCNHNAYFFYFKFNTFDSKQINTNQIEKNYIEVGTCIRCVEAHPKNPDLVAFATYFGEINVIDMQTPENILCTSKVDTYFHKECIVSLKWVKLDSDYVLLSLSEEGKLLLWDLADGLKFPFQGYLLKFRMKDIKTPLLINPLVISQNHHDNLSFLIGTIGKLYLSLEGNLYRCVLTVSNNIKCDHVYNNVSGYVWRNSVKRILDNCTEDQILDIKKETEKYSKNKDVVEIGPDEFFKSKPDMNKIYKNALKSNFEKHISVVKCISFNNFVKNVFLSTSYDGSLRIYNYNQSKFLLSTYLDNDFFTIANFSPHHPNLIVAGTCKIQIKLATGKIIFYKIKEQNFKIIHKIERKQENSMLTFPVVSLKFNNYEPDILLISYDDGITEIMRLSPSFSTFKYEEINRFQKMINSLMN